MDVNEVRTRVAGPDHHRITMREVEKKLHTTTYAVNRLVEKGFLKVESVMNPVSKRPQRVVNPLELDRFQKDYVSLYVLATERGFHIRRMKRELVTAGVHPVADPTDLSLTLYRRSDLTWPH